MMFNSFAGQFGHGDTTPLCFVTQPGVHFIWEFDSGSLQVCQHTLLCCRCQGVGVSSACAQRLMFSTAPYQEWRPLLQLGASAVVLDGERR